MALSLAEMKLPARVRDFLPLKQSWGRSRAGGPHGPFHRQWDLSIFLNRLMITPERGVIAESVSRIYDIVM